MNKILPGKVLKIKSSCYAMLFIVFLFLSFEGYAQNRIGVSFSDGFIGDVVNTTSASGAVKTSSLGWTNIQFVQNSPSTIFVSQGNDIPGSAIITDNNGTKHTVTGYINWRAPNGTVSTVVFVPTETKTLATNGSNGAATYNITLTKYIGMTFNGQSLTITGGSVTGNAALSQVLQSLNDYLASQPKLTITATSVNINETGGNAQVEIKLNAAATVVVSVKYATSNGTATAGNDYTATNGTVTFAIGETSKTISVPIINDADPEPTETLTVTFSDPVNAALLGETATINIADDDLADNTPPVLTGPGPSTGLTSAKSIPENTTAVHTFTADEPVTWSKAGGTDESKFTINVNFWKHLLSLLHLILKIRQMLTIIILMR